MIADQCPRCAALRAEADAWRRLYQGLARDIAEAAHALQATPVAPRDGGTP